MEDPPGVGRVGRNRRTLPCRCAEWAKPYGYPGGERGVGRNLRALPCTGAEWALIARRSRPPGSTGAFPPEFARFEPCRRRDRAAFIDNCPVDAWTVDCARSAADGRDSGDTHARPERGIWVEPHKPEPARRASARRNCWRSTRVGDGFVGAQPGWETELVARHDGSIEHDDASAEKESPGLGGPGLHSPEIGRLGGCVTPGSTGPGWRG
jgi:hypothetical protein